MLSSDNFLCVCAINVSAGLAVTGRGAATPAVNPGAGRFQITLETPLDSTVAMYQVRRRGASIGAGNLLTTYNVLDVSDTVKEVESIVEGAVGGASAMANTTFSFFAYRVN